jgi:ArsR family transcriptional regulator
MTATARKPRNAAKPVDVCQIECVHRDAVTRAASALKPESTLQRLGEFYKALGDPTRLKIITALVHEELCVCDIACLTGMSESAISHQLRVLRAARLVKYRRHGRIVYYSLADGHVADIIEQGLRHAEE